MGQEGLGGSPEEVEGCIGHHRVQEEVRRPSWRARRVGKPSQKARRDWEESGKLAGPIGGV